MENYICFNAFVITFRIHIKFQLLFSARHKNEIQKAKTSKSNEKKNFMYAPVQVISGKKGVYIVMGDNKKMNEEMRGLPFSVEKNNL